MAPNEEDNGGGVPMLIAMKGHPGAGKTTVARSLASALNLPLLDKDDVRDNLQALQASSSSSSMLNDLSYHVIWQIASTQLRLGLSVIVDSPLSRRSHLECLAQMASSSGARLLIVECKPKDEGEWRRRLEGRAATEGGGGEGWHKPSTWQDMERLLEGYGGCTEYDVGGVPKVVVDTTAALAVEEIVSSVIQFIQVHMRHHPIMTS